MLLFDHHKKKRHQFNTLFNLHIKRTTSHRRVAQCIVGGIWVTSAPSGKAVTSSTRGPVSHPADDTVWWWICSAWWSDKHPTSRSRRLGDCLGDVAILWSQDILRVLVAHSVNKLMLLIRKCLNGNDLFYIFRLSFQEEKDVPLKIK